MRRLFCVLLALLPALGAAAAQEEPRQLPPPADLGFLLREAETNSPAIRAASARLEAARRVPSQAEALPDPEVGVAYTNDGLDRFTLGETEFAVLSLTWSQEIPYPGKLKRSGEVASRQFEMAEKELDRTKREVAAAVKMAYAELYRLDRTAAILEETRAVLRSLTESTRKRYEVGQGIQESVLKAQTEILRLEAESARVTQDRRVAEVRLNAAAGRLADAPLGPATLRPEGTLPGPPEDLADLAVEGSPEIAAAEAATRRSEAGLRRARLDLKPDFLWSASYQYRGDLDPMVMGMFGLRLPVHRARKQAQAVLQAESELEATRHEASGVQVRTRAMVRELAARVQRADRLVALFSQGVIPQATSALESARASYGVGRIGFLDLLNDLTVLLNARIELATQEADRIQGFAALEPLLGRELVQPAASSRREGGEDAAHR